MAGSPQTLSSIPFPLFREDAPFPPSSNPVPLMFIGASYSCDDGYMSVLSLSLSFFFFFFFLLHLWHVEFLGPGMELLPQQPPGPLQITPDP